MSQQATRRLNDGVRTLLDGYEKALDAGKLEGGVQQASELSSAVHVASMVHTASGLVRLGRELECASLLDPEKTATETDQLAKLMNERAASGERQLQAMRLEMQLALRELEESFYAGSSGQVVPTRTATGGS